MATTDYRYLAFKNMSNALEKKGFKLVNRNITYGKLYARYEFENHLVCFSIQENVCFESRVFIYKKIGNTKMIQVSYPFNLPSVYEKNLDLYDELVKRLILSIKEKLNPIPNVCEQRI